MSQKIEVMPTSRATVLDMMMAGPVTRKQLEMHPTVSLNFTEHPSADSLVLEENGDGRVQIIQKGRKPKHLPKALCGGHRSLRFAPPATQFG